MSRNLKAPALVLKMNPVGENHRGLSMLVAGEGLLRPLAFGAQGRRSALRATAVPFNSGLADLHYDGVKDQWRLTAFDPSNTHDGLRENLDRFYSAASWAEILLKTHGSGEDSEALLSLATKALALITKAEEDEVKRLNLAFLWHFLAIEGVQPDVTRCGRCGKTLPPGGGSPGMRFWPNGLLVGAECADSRGGEISDGARAWLLRISGEFEDSVRVGMNPKGLEGADRWLVTVVQSLLEAPLKSRSLSP